MNGDLLDYQKLFDAISVMTFVITNSGEILAANHAVLERLGYSRDELIGSHILSIHPPNSEAEIRRVLDALSISEVSVCTLPVVSKHGEYIEVETKIYKGTWEGESVLFGFCSDVGKQRSAERKWQAVFQYSPIPIMLSRLSDGMVYDANGAWCRMLGYARHEIIGKTTTGLGVWANPHDRAIIIDALNKSLDISDFPVTLVNRDNELIYGEISGSQISIDGEALWITSLIDQTAERQLKLKIDEIREITISSAMEEIDKQLLSNKYIRPGSAA